jgi:predicted nucleic acid-binding protein
MIGLGAFLRRHRRLAIDASIFIYQLESNPRYLPITDPLFAWLELPGHSAVTSTVTMTELLVLPYQLADQSLANHFYGLLSIYPNLEWVPPSLTIADTAARIRAGHRLKTPDALQAATAIHSAATGLVTKDSVFQRVEEFETLVLDQA